MGFRYFYRGTTAGWPGNETLQGQRITCTTTDPLVAALFGVECRNHGPAVILMAREEQFLGLIGPSNHFAVLESAINLMITPLEFAGKIERVLDVEEVLKILGEMGFDGISIRLRDKEMLREALLATYEAGQRMNEEQLLEFVTRMLGAEQ